MINLESTLYNNILISIDNSNHSREAGNIGVQLAMENNAKITGLHVYSGQFHRKRFKILEEYLPEKYKKEDILDYQRKIHSVLIKRGLEIISLEYMKELNEICQKNDIYYGEKIIDGKTSDVIINQSNSLDLVIMGAQGMGVQKEIKFLGSNTKRVLQKTETDLLVARKTCDFKTIAVGIDGSDYSNIALERSIELAKKFGSSLILLSCFDPNLHPTVFKSLTSVLSNEAGKVFKFEEQQDLHNKVIDFSLEDLYKGYLNQAKIKADKYGLQVNSILLKGKPYYAICNYLQKNDTDLLVIGRHGLHQGTYDLVGSNTERIVENVSTNVLVVSKNSKKNIAINLESHKVDVSENEGELYWNDDSKKRLNNIPSFARPMAVLSIERYARENGISIITPDVMKKARGQYEK